jgi:hypothetical protein
MTPFGRTVLSGLGTALLGCVVFLAGYFLGVNQKLDEQDGPKHDCAPCEREHMPNGNGGVK